jgi:hypothetical protein
LKMSTAMRQPAELRSALTAGAVMLTILCQRAARRFAIR